MLAEGRGGRGGRERQDLKRILQDHHGFKGNPSISKRRVVIQCDDTHSACLLESPAYCFVIWNIQATR